MSLNGDATMVGTVVTIGSAAASEDEESEEVEPDVYLKITEESAELKSATDIRLEAEADVLLKAKNVMVESEEITLKCSYGEITVEEMMKRIERIEDQLGLPHTI